MTIERACENFLVHCRVAKKLSVNTLAAYAIDLQEFRRFAGADTAVAAVDRQRLRGYLAHLADERGLKATSVKRRVACLKVMFRWLELDEVITVNPFHRLRAVIRLPKRLPRALSAEEAAKLRTTALALAGLRRPLSNSAASMAATTDFRAVTTLVAVEILLCTGMRVGELATVGLGDLARVDGTITVNGKGSRQRQVFLSNEEIALVGAYLPLRSGRHPRDDRLIVTEDGVAATTDHLRRLVRDVAEAANLQRRVTPHMLRHTAATQFLENGLDIRFVQRLLGHQSITTTEGYTHVSNASLKAAILRARAREWQCAGE